MPWKCQYLLCWRSMLRCVHSGTLSPKLENKQPNFLRSKYYVKNAHVEPFLGSERVSPHKVLLIPVSLVFSQTPLYPNNISTRNWFLCFVGCARWDILLSWKIIYFLNFFNSFELLYLKMQEIIKIIRKIKKRVTTQGIFLFFDFFEFY